MASLIGEAPFFLEVNPQMPRTFGANQIHVSQVVGLEPRSTTRWSRSRRRCPTTGTAPSPRSSPSGSPTARRCRPASAASPTRCSAMLARPPRPRHPHRAALRRRDRPRRGRRRDRHAQEAAPRTRSWRRSPSAPSGSTTSCTRTARSSCCPSTTSTTRGSIAREPQLRLDQRHHRGRPLRPVRVGDDGRPLLVLQRRPGRLRPRRDVLRQAGRRSSCCTRRHATGSMSKIRPTLTPGSVVTTSRTPSTRSSPSTASPSCAAGRCASGPAR